MMLVVVATASLIFVVALMLSQIIVVMNPKFNTDSGEK
jgi:hypothetical protein